MSQLSVSVQTILFADALNMSANLADPLVEMGGPVPVLLEKRFVDALQWTFDVTPPPPLAQYLSIERDTAADFWRDIVHILPRSFDAGNILSEVNQTIDIYNAYTRESVQITTFTNNAGAGTDITNLPGLPFQLTPQTSLLLNLVLTPEGAPTVDSTLVFGTDEGYDLLFPLTATRLVVFPFEPDVPVVEQLSFLTDLMLSKNGEEQRMALRKAPRQSFSFPIVVEEGEELSQLDVLLFDWQSRVFGLPVWTEPTFLTAPAQVGDTVVQVESTANADYRVGSLATLWANKDVVDMIEVDSFDGTSITFASPLSNNFEAGTLVMPARTAVLEQQFRGSRKPVGAAQRSLSFRVVDNLVGDSFPDASHYTVSGGALDGEIVLTELIGVENDLRETFDRRLVVLDNDTGKFSTTSPEAFNRRAYPFTIFVTNRTDLWRVRRLLHALRGRQRSFFVPVGYRELTLTQTWVITTDTITISNIRYSRHGRERGRYEFLQIELNSGTIIQARVTASAPLSADEEQLSLSITAPSNILPSDVRRIHFLERVRLDRDDVVLTHIDALGQASISFPVRSVRE